MCVYVRVCKGEEEEGTYTEPSAHLGMSLYGGLRHIGLYISYNGAGSSLMRAWTVLCVGLTVQ